ncbi:hypothetical protein [Bacillus sp. ISL-46]|uniref:hypothetical protein n=1 Tax=Bacillus sp. ISL-46 TaxID=2819129 RepID=UPI001BE52BB8|nr:hypothetical protein [Bacillus sp. ISL-46]MBT2721624.1 hypothetical protein [Bacillus sp. ISL-46]
MKQLVFNNRDYEVTENENEVLLTDISNNPIKFDISFSKDPKKNKIAKDGLTIFFTELFRGD